MYTTDYDRIEAAIRYLAKHRERQPELAEWGAHNSLSRLGRRGARRAGTRPPSSFRVIA